MANAENVREVETASMNDIIDLNVGGTKFQTTRYAYYLIDSKMRLHLEPRPFQSDPSVAF